MVVCHVIIIVQEMKEKVRRDVHSTALPAGEGVWQSHLHKLVLSPLTQSLLYCLFHYARIQVSSGIPGAP